MPLEQSILKSTKKVIQIGDDDESFDHDIIIHINTALSTLNDLGVGSEGGFAIEGEDETWEDFLGPDPNPVWLSKVKTCIYLRVRLLFDPPSTSYALAAMEKQLEEVEWRLNINREAVDWTHPDPPSIDEEVEEELVLDGGDP